MKRVLFALVAVMMLTAFKSDKPAYYFYNQKGKKVKYEKVLKAALEADVVFFGESHNNPIAHWMELELTKDFYKAKGDNLILGAEMFERDNQLILNEYLAGKISGKSFKDEARLWPNYSTDYKPLVEFAKEHKLPFIATNVPRRYASVAYKKGFEGLDSLDAEAKSYIAPLPIAYDADLKCYKDMLSMMGMGAHVNENFPKAQAVKDATMAYSIAGYAEKGKLFFHYNGSYHSDNYQSILWHLNQYKPGLKIVTISTVEQPDIDTISNEFRSQADFILVVPEDMTRTY
jgi:uncharacterized iron-regulated protein